MATSDGPTPQPTPDDGEHDSLDAAVAELDALATGEFEAVTAGAAALYPEHAS